LGGLDLGTIGASTVLLSILVLTIFYTMRQQRKAVAESAG